MNKRSRKGATGQKHFPQKHFPIDLGHPETVPLISRGEQCGTAVLYGRWGHRENHPGQLLSVDRVEAAAADFPNLFTTFGSRSQDCGDLQLPKHIPLFHWSHSLSPKGTHTSAIFMQLGNPPPQQCWQPSER